VKAVAVLPPANNRLNFRIDEFTNHDDLLQ
jgi:hypothetical protein